VWIAATDGSGAPRRLTDHPENDSHPRWASDGRTVVFLSARGGSSQVWSVAREGGSPRALTSLPVDVSGFVLFPDGKRIALVAEVYPDALDSSTAADALADAAKRDAERAASKVKARIYDRLLFRHWDSWEDGKRSHVFVGEVMGKDAPKDLMAGIDADSPTHPFGGSEEIAVSPDGREVVFAAKLAGREAAWSTNVDLWSAPADGSAKPRSLTADNAALDNLPAFSPDGRTLAYVAMARPGYESDRQRIVLLDRASGARRVVGEDWDRSAQSIEWSSDGKTIYATADHLGNRGLFAVDVASGKVAPLVEKGSCDSPRACGDRVVFALDTLHSPAELWSIRRDGGDLRPITKLNAERMAAAEIGDFEPFTFAGAKGETVRGFVMKPVGFAEGSRFPVAFLVHGGPQGSFGNHFHYRWNPGAYSGAGYGVVFVDFHGSTGYGQTFTDSIRGDWGGAPYEDLMKGLDAALARYPWLDGTRVAALGASYGGYMVNWIHGKTDRFRALVCHDGNLDERMAYFDTEELWFPEWDHGGTPWENPEGYAKHNPIDLVKNWKTPTLVIHGANDFRVVETQGLSTFTALQRRGVPSRLLHFPDENHWVLKPLNSRLWHREVLGWLDRWVKNAG
jgi:dipeptidyl aminopeptidase/acylaminoacyl peptidase